MLLMLCCQTIEDDWIIHGIFFCSTSLEALHTVYASFVSAFAGCIKLKMGSNELNIL